MSENKISLYEKLASIRAELSKKEIKKSGANVHLKFQYLELSDFLPAILQLEREHKVTSIFNLDNEKGLATITLFDSETPYQIELAFPLVMSSGNQKNPIQDLGATITYMRRYLYVSLYGICENDIVDSEDTKEKKPVKNEISELEKMRNDFNVFLKTKLTSEEISQFSKDIKNELKMSLFKTTAEFQIFQEMMLKKIEFKENPKESTVSDTIFSESENKGGYGND